MCIVDGEVEIHRPTQARRRLHGGHPHLVLAWWQVDAPDRAQSLLAEFGELPQPGARSGELEDGRYRWRLQVEPWADPAPRGGPVRIDPNAARLLRLQLQVEWGEGGPARRVQLSSLRLAMPQAEGVGRP